MFSLKTLLTLIALVPSVSALKWDCWKDLGCNDVLQNHDAQCLCNIVSGVCTSDGKPCFQAATLEGCWAKGAYGASVWGDSLSNSNACWMNKYDCWSDCDCSRNEKDSTKWYKSSNVHSTSAAMGYISGGTMIDGAQACFDAGASSASVWGHSYYNAYERVNNWVDPEGWSTSNGFFIPYTCPTNPTNPGAEVCDTTGGGFGDPHIKTLTGEIFDFMGECDLIFLEAPSLNMTIHIRTQFAEFKQWSYIESAALSINGEVMEVGDYGSIIVNGVYNADDREIPETVGGYPIELEVSNKKTHTYRVLLGNGKYVEMKSYKFMVGISIDLPTEHLMDSQGLLGSVKKGGKKLGRDGLTVFADNDEYAKEWVVDPATDPLLFESPANHPGICEMPLTPGATTKKDNGIGAKKKSSPQRLGEKLAREEAIAACKNWHMNVEACIHDVMTTGDKDLAGEVY